MSLCRVVFIYGAASSLLSETAFTNVHVQHLEMCMSGSALLQQTIRVVGSALLFLCNMGRDVPSKCIKYSTLHFSLNALGFSVLSTWGSDPRVALGAFCMSFQKTLQTILSCVSHARAELVGQCCVCPICAGFCNVGAN